MALVITVEDNNIKVAKIPLQPKTALLATAEIYSKTWPIWCQKIEFLKKRVECSALYPKTALKRPESELEV